MDHNPVIDELLAKQCLHSILDIGFTMCQVTVKRTQLGPPNVFKPITRQAQNKRFGVRSVGTDESGVTRVTHDDVNRTG